MIRTSPRNSSEKKVEPDIGLAERLFEELQNRTSDIQGITRMSYGVGEEIAHSILKREAETIGLEIETDMACNSYVHLRGINDSPAIVIGSHLDSVPMGGNFDGAAGVLMGLSVISGLVKSGMVPPQTITVMATRAEESAWFSSSYIGSRASFGLLKPNELTDVKRSNDGISLGEAIAKTGGSIEEIIKGKSYWKPKDVGLFLEPHIEQGPMLDSQGLPLGLVTDIRGSLRFRNAVCDGAYSHSGTTPRALRQDTVLAVSKLTVKLDMLWEKLSAKQEDVTFTVGELNTDPTEASFSKVAGRTTFSIDIRSNSKKTLEVSERDLMAAAREIEKELNVKFRFGHRTRTKPAKMDLGVINELRHFADESNQIVTEMPCGAGHDAAVFASLGIPTGMLFIRNTNGSHNPYEQMKLQDFYLGASILIKLCQKSLDKLI